MAGQAGSQDNKARPGQRRMAQWTRDYARLPGIPDEYIGQDGAPRPAWARFFDAFAALSPADIERRFASADRHLREAGVTYRAPGETADRLWPLSHLPLIIDETDWRQLTTGIAQRAQLLEMILRDLYGEGRLVADGSVPAAAIAGSNEYLRAVCGVKPPGGRYLHLYAADVGRGPDGRWWVLSDRTQAPSGAGYALENRLVLSRAFSNLYKSMNVERVAPFFEAFRDALRASADRDEPRIGLLTPGAFNETYFEHATIARYLGFLLVEGDDLAVSGDRIHIRTVAGLKRLDVLLRRVDSNFLDPLELDASSHLGVPGLIDVLRKSGVVVANMPGSGVLEARALLGFLPNLCRRLLSEDLLMPHIATWWCGQKSAREEVLSRLDDFAIEGAYGRAVPGFPGSGPVLAGELSPPERERLRSAISDRGIDFVGQELVRLSTTPTWENGRITPRPFVLRVFAAATPNGWTILPGGFCRIADQPDARAVSMGDGARAADVWVVSDKPIAASTLLPAADTVRIRRIAGVVPSRAADNLFWLGRYLERAEATLRLIRALGTPTRDSGKGAPSGASTALHSVERIQRLLVTWGATSQASRANSAKVAAEALQSAEKFGSALSLLRSAQRTATSLRERLSPDAWQVITEMVERLSVEADDDDGIVSAAELSLQELASFAGLAQENMNRAAGWRFLEMGRRAERAINTARFARQFAYDEAGDEDLDVLLTLVDCQITYRSRYLVGPALAPVRDLAVLDPYNPRSVAFQVAALNEHIASLPSLKEHGLIERPQRLAVALQAMLTTAEAAALDVKALFALEQDLLNLADAIGLHYFPHGPNASRPEKLTGLA
ncbi:circularly permuted type 2 ATP-grasp protein [Bradyrhizobium sp. AUGA SZCCT0160]|uniref:circularly permuted type 2 ATP-grasp protein n=1 Tax=Bradyrhizobium sp. AUGA SZCCT0160 TaxID=2807662 RepID=UPI001BAC7554|nr:circularly permuted type 2 ATP-grasp protein [Bradyrhizobium sp. AUGA SZCCT0160]MBR1191636.1 circularly permuted type 2 ATP-grasp protein [Bradyrhizobium sp. AUGA SZCCT0160]